jgi:antitoxin component of MazEF toxin-antitoxin module
MPMAVEMIIRKLGNSLGGTFPKEFAEERNLKPGDAILVEVVKKLDLRKLPRLKFTKSTQELKNEARRGWD